MLFVDIFRLCLDTKGLVQTLVITYYLEIIVSLTYKSLDFEITRFWHFFCCLSLSVTNFGACDCWTQIWSKDNYLCTALVILKFSSKHRTHLVRIPYLLDIDQ